jgi:hypothetical protein
MTMARQALPAVGQVLWTAVLLGAAATVCIRQSVSANGDDLVQDYVSARVFLAGEPPYQDAPGLRTRYGFPPFGQPLPLNPHPPFAVLLVVPFASVAFSTALLAYQIVQVLCLAWAWNGACRTFARGGWLAATLGGPFGAWSPVWQGLDWGQPVGFVALATLLLWRVGRGSHGYGLAGVTLALACGLRPFYAIVLATAVRWPFRRWVVEGVAAIAVAALIFAITRLSPLVWLKNGSAVGDQYATQCGSIPGILGLTGLKGLVCYGLAAMVVAVARWRGAPTDPSLAAAFVLGLLTYPLAWFQYDVALISVLVWVVARAHARGQSRALFLTAIYVALRMVPNMAGNELAQQWLQVAARTLLLAAVIIVAREPETVPAPPSGQPPTPADA